MSIQFKIYIVNRDDALTKTQLKRRSLHDPRELAAAERSSGLVLAGYLAAGNPSTLVLILVRPSRSLHEQQAIVGRLNAVGDGDRQEKRRAA
jgi:hypothetical protein